MNQFSRTQLLLGSDAMERLANSRVAVFGIGGVGGYVVEALARSGVGFLDLVDDDEVSLTNVNRQIVATCQTVGLKKTTVMRQRVLDIDPQVKVVEHQRFFLPENADDFPFCEFDYVVDAVDTVAAKLELAVRCERLGIPIMSSMGTGNKLDPCALKVADIYQTSVCPLARVMRRELRKRGVQKLKVVYSEEVPIKPHEEALASNLLDAQSGVDFATGLAEKECQVASEKIRMATGRKSVPGSTAFVPPVAGLIIASEVVKDLAGING